MKCITRHLSICWIIGGYRMSRFKNYIMAPGTLNEAKYEGNIGFEELSAFYKKANDKEIEQMEKILNDEDWEAFKELIRKVVGTKLK